MGNDEDDYDDDINSFKKTAGPCTFGPSTTHAATELEKRCGEQQDEHENMGHEEIL